MFLPQLRRVRWAVRATLLLGVAASVVANVLHALDNPISQAIAAWPPLALLLTVELISRVPVHHRYLAFARLVATATIAGIAAWVSYWHMAGVAARYGETGASPYLLPLSVDGLIIVASICLVELGGRISALQAEGAAGAGPATVAPGAAAQVVPVTVGLPIVARPTAVGGVDADHPAQPAFTPTVTRRARAAAGAASQPPKPATTTPATPAGQAANGKPAGTKPGRARQAVAGRPAAAGKPAPRARRSPAETVALADRITADRPEATDPEVAAELGISTSRLRSVRREAARNEAVKKQAHSSTTGPDPAPGTGTRAASAGPAAHGGRTEATPTQSEDLRLAA